MPVARQVSDVVLVVNSVLDKPDYECAGILFSQFGSLGGLYQNGLRRRYVRRVYRPIARLGNSRRCRTSCEFRFNKLSDQVRAFRPRFPLKLFFRFRGVANAVFNIGWP